MGILRKQLVNKLCRTAWLCAIGALLGLAVGSSSAATAQGCQKLVLLGEVQAGQEWRADFGQGWVFRMLPIQPVQAFSGWDLVVDRAQPAGYPDALLLATPPYNSISERELGTTFGLRSQDAIGWNGRSFRFLTSPEAFQQGQKLFLGLNHTTGAATPADTRTMQQLLELGRKSAAGQFRILDARLEPGVGDAAPYAQNWALAAARTPHSYEPPVNGKSTQLGAIHWIKFSVTLWLPQGWKTPRETHAERGGCE